MVNCGDAVMRHARCMPNPMIAALSRPPGKGTDDDDHWQRE